MNEPSAVPLLLATLQLAVPVWASRLRSRPMSALIRRADEIAVEIGSKGDVLQFGGKKGDPAAIFNALAEGLAILSMCPGGVTFYGIHWEHSHDGGD